MSILKRLQTPVFWAEGHPGELDRANWTIEVTGLCDNPQTFTWDQLLALPKTLADARLTSVTRWSVRGTWGGVKLSDIFDIVKIKPEVKYIRFWSVNNIYDTSITIKIARQEKTLLTYEIDNEYLEEDYGGPVRLICPYLWGYKSAKSVVKVELMDHYVSGYWEIRGYSDDARIEACKVRDINSKKRLRAIPDGEVVNFLDE